MAAGAYSTLDRFDCYELCVQSPRHVTQLLRAIHARGESGSTPAVLREDFSGTAAVSRRWIRDAIASGIAPRALCVDVDGDALSKARAAAESDGCADSLELLAASAISIPVRPNDACDCIFVGNFSIGYIHQRADLIQYLSNSRQRLALANAGFGGGVFVCDTYDSAHKYALGAVHRRHPSRGREIIHYTWQHRAADVLNAMVENAIHFRIEIDGEIVHDYPDAFVYRWRLWSIAELRDALHEVGFARVEVFAEIANGAVPINSPADMPESGVVCIAARDE